MENWLFGTVRLVWVDKSSRFSGWESLHGRGSFYAHLSRLFVPPRYRRTSQILQVNFSKIICMFSSRELKRSPDLKFECSTCPVWQRAPHHFCVESLEISVHTFCFCCFIQTGLNSLMDAFCSLKICAGSRPLSKFSHLFCYLIMIWGRIRPGVIPLPLC